MIENETAPSNVPFAGVPETGSGSVVVPSTTVPLYTPSTTPLDTTNNALFSTVLNPTPKLRSIVDITNDLKQKIDQKHLKTRDQAGQKLTYIPWYYAASYLDKYAAGWQYRVDETKMFTVESEIFDKKLNAKVKKTSNIFVITVSIGIPSLEGMVWRSATGYEEFNPNMFGDVASNAESMALRRAASKHGLGRYLYVK